MGKTFKCIFFNKVDILTRLALLQEAVIHLTDRSNWLTAKWLQNNNRYHFWSVYKDPNCNIWYIIAQISFPQACAICIFFCIYLEPIVLIRFFKLLAILSIGFKYFWKYTLFYNQAKKLYFLGNLCNIGLLWVNICQEILCGPYYSLS